MTSIYYLSDRIYIITELPSYHINTDFIKNDVLKLDFGLVQPYDV